MPRKEARKHGLMRKLFLGAAILYGLSQMGTSAQDWNAYPVHLGDTVYYATDTCTVGAVWEDASAVAQCADAVTGKAYYISYDPEPGVWEPWEGCYDYRKDSATWGQIMSTVPEGCFPNWNLG